MKYLTKFNESDYLKIGDVKSTPVDVSSDCKKFLDKYSNKLRGWKNALESINNLSTKYPTPTLDYSFYIIKSYDCEGRYVTGNIGYERGVNKSHARLRCALDHGFEVFATGFYDADKIDIDKEISGALKNLKNAQSRVENLYRLKE